MRRNFDLSTGLVALGAVAVLVSLFLEWYVPGLTAWDVFEIADWLLAALAGGALVVLFGETVGTTPPTRRLAWISGIVVLVVVAQLLDPPPAARDAGREVGAWIALGGSALMVAGVVLALMQISVTIDVAERERRRRTSAVDAREGRGARGPEGGAGAEAPGEPGGLWKAPRASSGGDPAEESTEPETVVVDADAVEEPSDAPRTSVDEDPQRTQPMPRTERPDERE